MNRREHCPRRSNIDHISGYCANLRRTVSGLADAEPASFIR
jgi:hypothetical protein